MITTFNTAVNETASEILGKPRQEKTKQKQNKTKKHPWVTAETLDLCDNRLFFQLKCFTTVWLNVLKTGGFLFEVGGSVNNEILDLIDFITLLNESIKCDNDK